MSRKKYHVKERKGERDKEENKQSEGSDVQSKLECRRKKPREENIFCGARASMGSKSGFGALVKTKAHKDTICYSGFQSLDLDESSTRAQQGRYCALIKRG